MLNQTLKDTISRLLPRVQMPAQYLGGELNSVVKDHRRVRGKLCLTFPDTSTLGTSHHGFAGAVHDHERRPAVGVRTRLHAVARPAHRGRRLLRFTRLEPGAGWPSMV